MFFDCDALDEAEGYNAHDFDALDEAEGHNAHGEAPHFDRQRSFRGLGGLGLRVLGLGYRLGSCMGGLLRSLKNPDPQDLNAET